MELNVRIQELMESVLLMSKDSFFSFVIEHWRCSTKHEINAFIAIIEWHKETNNKKNKKNVNAMWTINGRLTQPVLSMSQDTFFFLPPTRKPKGYQNKRDINIPNKKEKRSLMPSELTVEIRWLIQLVLLMSQDSFFFLGTMIKMFLQTSNQENKVLKVYNKWYQKQQVYEDA